MDNRIFIKIYKITRKISRSRKALKSTTSMGCTYKSPHDQNRSVVDAVVSLKISTFSGTLPEFVDTLKITFTLSFNHVSNNYILSIPK